MSIGNLQKILLHDIHNLLSDLILKHETTSLEFVWGFQCSLLGSKIHYLGQEKSNSLHGSTQVVNIHYLGQIHNLGQNSNTITDVAEKFGGLPHYCLMEKIGYFTFYSGQYINLVKNRCSTQKLCTIVSSAS